ncbi:putative lipoprotein [Streptococcus parasanguinis SK236]|nr:putative lipoprotein [Streptococcus parasanguinis SK236]
MKATEESNQLLCLGFIAIAACVLTPSSACVQLVLNLFTL